MFGSEKSGKLPIFLFWDLIFSYLYPTSELNEFGLEQSRKLPTLLILLSGFMQAGVTRSASCAEHF